MGVNLLNELRFLIDFFKELIESIEVNQAKIIQIVRNTRENLIRAIKSEFLV